MKNRINKEYYSCSLSILYFHFFHRLFLHSFYLSIYSYSFLGESDLKNIRQTRFLYMTWTMLYVLWSCNKVSALRPLKCVRNAYVTASLFGDPSDCCVFVLLKAKVRIHFTIHTLNFFLFLKISSDCGVFVP